MARKGLMYFVLISFIFAQNLSLSHGPENFETGVLMEITREKAVINEAIYKLDRNVKITDIAGNTVPIELIKLPAECKYQTNIMAGEITERVKIIKLIILRPVPMESYGKKFEKLE